MSSTVEAQGLPLKTARPPSSCACCHCPASAAQETQVQMPLAVSTMCTAFELQQRNLKLGTINTHDATSLSWERKGNVDTFTTRRNPRDTVPAQEHKCMAPKQAHPQTWRAAQLAGGGAQGGAELGSGHSCSTLPVYPTAHSDMVKMVQLTFYQVETKEPMGSSANCRPHGTSLRTDWRCRLLP